MKSRTKKYLTFRKGALAEISRLRGVLKNLVKEAEERIIMWNDLSDEDNAMFWAAQKEEIETQIYNS